MQSRLTQEERIVNKLNRDGYITRNEALRQVPAITRTTAIINRLKRMGWEIEDGRYTEDKSDFIYRVKKSPLRKIIYKVGDKEIITYSK